MDRGALRSDERSTTVPEVRARRSVADPTTFELSWLHPRAVDPPARPAAGDERELLIGRDPACDVRLEGADVSRRHGALRRSGDRAGLTIVDLGSRNGIRVNGQVVTSASLTRGDVVGLGEWIGVVTEGPASFAEIAPGLMGGARLQSALQPLRAAAASDLPVVITGETGTGKEIVARAVHAWSGRRGPLVAVNCAALPDGLAEAELFGYRRGAFTGADRSSPGFFRSAEGGTLLLDEVIDLPLGVQAKLLRVLEQREVQPLGETRPVPIDVRIVAAGQRSLPDAARDGRFRADLVARLDGVAVKLPALRERREDIPPLFASLIGQLGPTRAPRLAADLVECLCLYDWPFNVRELVLLARRLLVLHGDQAALRAQHLPERMQPGGPATASPAAGADHSFRVAEPPAPAAQPAPPAHSAVGVPALVSALRLSSGNVARAAMMLGISRQRAYRLMEEEAIDLRALRKPAGPAR